MKILQNEANTRLKLIDKQLVLAGWSIPSDNLVTEFAINPLQNVHDKVKHTQYIDYALLDSEKKPVAIVEAKRTDREPIVAYKQSSDYADFIKAEYGIEPFIFLSNGEEIWFWDRQTSAPYQVSSFFTPADLERLSFLRKYRIPLNNLSLDFEIASRAYQQEAIKSVTEAIERCERNFLLVMATGSGKTRTVVALVDLLMKANWIQRVLFLVDRRELARQALGDFKEYMPHVSRSRIEGKIVDDKSRIHVATYPSMMQVYKQLSAGFYDLIIADESHRSIYNYYKTLFDYFAAMQLGLTATPTDYIDHNTFELFKCSDGLPTFYYPYQKAVNENYLAQYRVLEAKTAFQIEGIKAGQLPDELQKQIEEKGLDLSDINFEGTDLEKRVTNTGTNDVIVQEFFTHCRKDSTGTIPAKSIIFAMSHRHALELLESFRRVRPDLQRRGLAQVIDSRMERAEEMLDDFKHKNMPRVAISVDMLDTGVDVPSVQNLVFAKPVFSYVKFWQMVGRGTRLWEDKTTKKQKKDFLIIDYWNNFSFFNLNPEGEIASTTEPLPVRLFRARLDKLEYLVSAKNKGAAKQTEKQLQNMLSQIPTDSLYARPYQQEIEYFQQKGAILKSDLEAKERLRNSLAPLMRLLANVNQPTMTFELRLEQLAFSFLTKQKEEVEKKREQIISDINLLPLDLPEVRAIEDELNWVLSEGFWEHLNYDRIMKLQSEFAPLLRYKQKQKREIIKLNLPDRILNRHWIIYGPSGEGAFADTYREQIEAQVRRLASELHILQGIQRGEEIADKELQELSNALNRPDLFITEERLREVYKKQDADLVTFMRHILTDLKLPDRETQIAELFDKFINEHPHFSTLQINFLRTVKTAVQRGAKIQREDLTQSPFDRIGDAQKLFTSEEQDELLTIAQKLVA